MSETIAAEGEAVVRVYQPINHPGAIWLEISNLFWSQTKYVKLFPQSAQQLIAALQMAVDAAEEEETP